MSSLLSKIFGDSNERQLKKLRPMAEQVNSLEPEFERLSNEQLRDKTTEFRGRHLAGESLDSLLPEAFAAVREAAKRTLGQRHHDVQLLAGMVLHSGKIAEMKTGEGKTLVATLPLYLNALAGKGAHLVTPNDYLSRLGGGWMGPIYHLLGLSVGVIAHEFAGQYDPDYQDPQPHGDERLNHWRLIPRQDAYLADITYGTNNEFGFDYLRDHMASDASLQVQRALRYAIVDEVDNILIDEARTPLIISGPAEESAHYYTLFARIVPRLHPEEDFAIDERTRTLALTDEGIDRVEKTLSIQNLYDPANYELTHYLENALKAQFIFKLDKDYVVKDGEIVIVDEFTGRLMLGRRYSEGLHQAIEAKEGVRVQRENVTLARITFQNYFRLYEKLAGMTGTAATEADEFRKIYNLDVMVVPTHRPMIREDLSDLVFKTEDAKFRAVVDDIEQLYKEQRPVLVGTTSIEKSEYLSEMLARKGVPHQVLNAKQHEREALVIAQAGRPCTVTIATNMAGRGVDILLGGNADGLVAERLRKRELKAEETSPAEIEQALAEVQTLCQADREKVLARGGLHILGTERHEARRIDNQLRGRAGRQGDPGSSRFYVSLEDELMRRFGGARIAGLMDRLGLEEDVPLEHSWVTKSIENAQTKVEAYNFDIRKHQVEYDDVLNKHREIFYADRQKVLVEESLREMVLEWIEEELTGLASAHLAAERAEEWDLDGLLTTARTIFPVPQGLATADLEGLSREEVADKLFGLAEAAYAEKERQLGSELMRRLEKAWMLTVMDRLWTQHLTAMDDLQSGIGLQAYGQRDPLVMYKIEAHRMFEELLETIRREVVTTIFHVTITTQEPAHRPPEEMATNRDGETERQPVRAAAKVGRNDRCPCGSGKKYKRCHGR